MVVEEGVIRFPIRSPFKGESNEGRVTVHGFAP
jgi:hypothetical protein